MTKTRITKTMRFEDIRSMLNSEVPVHGSTLEDLMAFIGNEIDLLARKNKPGGEKKMTAVQKANEGHKALIVDFLALNPESTATEILKGVPELNDFSNQKVSALIRQLKEAGRVTVTERKGRSLFSLPQV